jgi:hypothetical protein
LLRSKLGKVFIALYYIVSPPIARTISNSQILRKLVRKGLVHPLASLCRNLSPRNAGRQSP